jgi:tonB-dependent receptor family protein
MTKPASRLSILSLSLLAVSAAFASDEPQDREIAELETITVTASADASKGG